MSNVTIDCKVLQDTGKAYLLEIHDVEVWIPSIMCENVHRRPRKTYDRVSLCERYYENKIVPKIDGEEPIDILL